MPAQVAISLLQDVKQSLTRGLGRGAAFRPSASARPTRMKQSLTRGLGRGAPRLYFSLRAQMAVVKQSLTRGLGRGANACIGKVTR